MNQTISKVNYNYLSNNLESVSYSFNIMLGTEVEMSFDEYEHTSNNEVYSGVNMEINSSLEQDKWYSIYISDPNIQSFNGVTMGYIMYDHNLVLLKLSEKTEVNSKIVSFLKDLDNKDNYFDDLITSMRRENNINKIL